MATILLYSEHRKRYIWNGVILLCATFLALYIPVDLFMQIESIILDVGYWLCTAVFIADVVIRFSRFRQLQARGDKDAAFFKGWIFVDIVAAIPFSPLFGWGFLELFRLVKLVRVVNFIRIVRQAEVRFSIILTLISFVYWTALLFHFLCCGWMDIYGVDDQADNTTNYISAFYWTITTLTSVGYGDIVPTTNAQRLYSIMVQITGIAVFGYLIANVVTIVTKLDAAKERYDRNVELLTTALKRRGLAQDLQRRILDYYAHLRDEHTGFDETAFLKTLPESLRREAALDLKKEFIESITLFKNADQQFIIDVALKLELIIATPGDYIFKADDPGKNMYFVISGTLDVFNKEEDQLLTQLRAGDFFGEIALFRKIPRSATVRANEYCNLYKLNRKTYESVLTNYPKIARQIEEKAKMREERYFED